ncbi:hypothetical protein C1646_776927 [Rhizophagus diaphanus]|nr:hypothetical protein C1646_776927 [Rhizophagus diaphanus] [Rhizophagus sp. MUCL 43196]
MSSTPSLSTTNNMLITSFHNNALINPPSSTENKESNTFSISVDNDNLLNTFSPSNDIENVLFKNGVFMIAALISAATFPIFFKSITILKDRVPFTYLIVLPKGHSQDPNDGIEYTITINLKQQLKQGQVDKIRRVREYLRQVKYYKNVLPAKIPLRRTDIFPANWRVEKYVYWECKRLAVESYKAKAQISANCVKKVLANFLTNVVQEETINILIQEINNIYVPKFKKNHENAGNYNLFSK